MGGGDRSRVAGRRRRCPGDCRRFLPEVVAVKVSDQLVKTVVLGMAMGAIGAMFAIAGSLYLAFGGYR